MDINLIVRTQEIPAPFTPGETLFWDDPHISAQMLKAHLNPDLDLASRRSETIQKSVDWLTAHLGLQAGGSILDLGCGPGLYSACLTEKGLRVTGIDYSQRSIDYAVQYALLHNLDIHYRYQNYLTLNDECLYDAALLIYGDFCTLSPQQRQTLLGNVRRVLKPGGYFVLDVTTALHHQRHGSRNAWYAAEKSFWKAGPHLVLEEGFDDTDQSIFLDQYVVIDENERVSVYRNWFQDFTRESITEELETAGFTVCSVWNDLTGAPYSKDGEWIGIIAKSSGSSAAVQET